MHCNSIGCVHEELRDAHQVLDRLQLQPQEVPVYCIAPYGLEESKDGHMKARPAASEQNFLWVKEKNTSKKSLNV